MKLQFALICFVLPILSMGQKIDSMMNVYAENFPQEKIYVHFDKNIYNAGETIWYKVYLMADGFPSLISKNFYTELSDDKGNVIERKVTPLYESTTAGNFDLPNKVAGAHLHFRAYTSWMLNFDTAFLYEKDIRIANGKKDSLKLHAKKDWHLQFFPEGGDIVAGVENNIAFKATDIFGLPINVRGVIRDGSGKEVANFESVHDGMGSFIYSPEKSDSLFAVWKDAEGNERSTPLPSVKNSGAALRVLSMKGKVLFNVARTPDSSGENDQFIIIGHMNQHMIYKAKINLKESFMSGGSIPVSQLPTGILQITLFNANMLPIAERIVFVNNYNYSFIADIHIDAKGMGKRGINILDIVVPDSLKSNLSISVTDALADGISPNDDNIISRFLLTGDIKGHVYNPGFYFLNESDSLLHYLDLVMLTNGWRRFKWDQLARGKIPTIKFIDQDHLSMNVEVLGVSPSTIAKDEQLNAIIRHKDSSTQVIQIPHLSSNKFGVGGLLFFDTAKVYYSFSINRNLSNIAAITFNNGLLRPARTVKPLTLTNDIWPPSDSSLLNRNRFFADETEHNTFNNQKIKTLETVTIKAKAKSPIELLDEKYATGMFAGGDAYTFDYANDMASYSGLDIFAFLQGKVPGLTITNTGSTVGSASVNLSWRGSTPTLFLNEMQVSADVLKSMPSTDIAYIKVFRPGASGVMGGGQGGAIAVYTKKGGDNRGADDPNFKGLEHTTVVGYSVMKEFYSPDYLNPDKLNENEDTRTTLYWKPFLLTDASTRKVSIKFYNNDITKIMRLVLEGVNDDGKLVRVEKILQ